MLQTICGVCEKYLNLRDGVPVQVPGRELPHLVHAECKDEALQHPEVFPPKLINIQVRAPLTDECELKLRFNRNFNDNDAVNLMQLITSHYR